MTTGDVPLADVWRGSGLESRHRGAFVVATASGEVVASGGDFDMPVFPRSAVKTLQALPLIESGAADTCGFGDAHLAVAQASHSGEPRHIAAVRAMLEAIDLPETALECGAHAPLSRDAADALVRNGERPSAVHNNCSGKHAGFLAVTRALGVTPEGYVGERHAVQRTVTDALARLTHTDPYSIAVGIDGCGIPTYAFPLKALASAFARFGEAAARAPGPEARLVRAATTHPFLVAGTGRFCTGVMEALGGAALVKTGAEGVFCAALPPQGLGIAVKCADGATRAAEVAVAALLSLLLPDAADRLAPWREVEVRNWAGIAVGRIVPARETFERLSLSLG